MRLQITHNDPFDNLFNQMKKFDNPVKTPRPTAQDIEEKEEEQYQKMLKQVEGEKDRVMAWTIAKSCHVFFERWMRSKWDSRNDPDKPDFLKSDAGSDPKQNLEKTSKAELTLSNRKATEGTSSSTT